MSSNDFFFTQSAMRQGSESTLRRDYTVKIVFIPFCKKKKNKKKQMSVW